MPARAISLIVLTCLPLLALAQAPAAGAPAANGAKAAAPNGGRDADFRDIRGYEFPAVSRTARDLQLLATAMQLRDYCADERVPDAFVKDQLARFGRITGRQESCRSLLDY